MWSPSPRWNRSPMDSTESFATNYAPGQVGLVGGAVPENPIAEVVGVRMPSYASLSLTYRFGRGVR